MALVLAHRQGRSTVVPIEGTKCSAGCCYSPPRPRWWPPRRRPPPSRVKEDKGGVERAKKAGVFIDSAVEHMLATAPVGSCQNDPLAEGCPHVRAVVYAPELFDIAFSERPEAMSPPAIPGPELSGDAPPEEATASRKRSKRAQRIRARAQRALHELDAGTARAAQIPPGYACSGKVNWSSPYYAAGLVQMDIQNICRAGIYDVDLWLVLKKYYSGRWYNMSGVWRYPSVPSNWYYSSHRRSCGASVYRQWIGQMDMYALWNGVWWAGSNAKQNGLNCGG
jgi:hypothetical protein